MTPPPPKPGPSLNRPLIGIAISVCAFVIACLISFTVLCGPGSGYNHGGDSTTGTFVLALLFLPIASLVICLIWLTVNAARKAMSD